MNKLKPYEFQQNAINKLINETRLRLLGEKENSAFYGDFYVSAGKSLIMAEYALHCQKVGAKLLMLARTGELVEQNSDAIFEQGGKCSIFSASLGRKSTYFDTVVGTEGTVANHLGREFSSWIPNVVLFDECLHGSSLIETEVGKVRIDDPALKGLKIKCLNEDTGEIHFEIPKRVFDNGVKRMSQYKLKNGKEIICTNTHKLYSDGQWTRAENLTTGQKIAQDGTQCTALKKLLRASAAVAREISLILRQGKFSHK